MTTSEPAPRFRTHPVETIVEIVCGVEAGLEPGTVEATIVAVAPGFHAQRRLAAALHDDPTLLTSGRPAGPPTIEKLIRALQSHEFQSLTLPRCADCDRPRELTVRNPRGERVCASCKNRYRINSADCASCGNHRPINFRDSTGRVFCRYCPPETGIDYHAEIGQHIRQLAPESDEAMLHEIITNTLPRPSQLRGVAWELRARPGLLAGEGVDISRSLGTLITTLTRHNIRNITPLTCPFCQRTVNLKNRYDGLLCCGTCYDNKHAEPCGHCGRRRPVVGRDDAGRPLCSNCFKESRENKAACSECGKVRVVARREHGYIICRACARVPYYAVCIHCGKYKRCYFARTSEPRCEPCSRLINNSEPCQRCMTIRPVNSRTPDGQPLCNQCTRERECCLHCRRLRYSAKRLEGGGSLCSNCYKKDPISFQHCVDCGALERLHHFGLCERCACPGILGQMLSGPDGVMRPELEPLYHALLANDPKNLLCWLGSRGPRQILTALAEGTGPLTHNTFDQLPNQQAARTLRAALITAGVLPDRDEQLARLERAIPRTLDRVADLDSRRILKAFATWSYLRRLRAASKRQPLTVGQVANTVTRLSKAVHLLNWLHEQGKTLATCRQADIDDWLDESRRDARQFVSWAVERGLAHNIAIAPRRSNITRDGLKTDDLRWTLARKLLNDTSIATANRAAGLLVLFYAQPTTRIAGLTIDQIRETPNGRVELLLGKLPLQLAEPVGDLFRELVSNRKGHAAIGHTDEHSWLFPGGAPGRPISPQQLASRLKRVGVQPRASRNTALIELAGSIHAAVLSRMLGISIDTATVWTNESGNTRPGYAAELQRRSDRPHPLD
ncbi:hypothetical protein ACFWM1_32630 [Nocardia sp. NPDC058379]|uniref:hypothetical protein n=1 Tax=unclassified Nocardia TaxID=2637762 RepID=UPI00364C312E